MRAHIAYLLRMHLAVLAFCLAASACAESGQPARSSDDDPSSVDEDEPSECTRDGQTEACTCGGEAGTRTCTGGTYGRCVCLEDEDDSAPRPSEPQCKAGYYVGNFSGKYRPGAFGFGIFPSGFEVDIAGGESFFDNSLPPLAFSLTAEEFGVGEFSSFTVGGGCMQGIATAVAITQSPFVAKLTGDLDCRTGEFTGVLEGYYTLIGIPGADFTFSGPLTAQFDLTEATLDDGAWSVEEPPALDGSPAGGGEGVWDAKWSAAKAPMRENDPCANIGAGGAQMPPAEATDGGTTAPDGATE